MIDDRYESLMFFVFAIIGTACFGVYLYKGFELIDTFKMILAVIVISAASALSYNQLYKNKLAQLLLLICSVFWFLYWVYFENDFGIGFILLIGFMILHFVFAVLRDMVTRDV